ncbi:hypothetical protein [Rhodoferax koreensis]|uniref:hypothetical protein n=1 Tax=Rhodoferax koreensis TaxID=1842727 RepID=UPI0012FFCFAF|nr:hypothetical protein [Rhodoferax koreense]
MSHDTSSPSAESERPVAEPLTSTALIQSVLMLGMLGLAAYKVLDAALRLL